MQTSDSIGQRPDAAERILPRPPKFKLKIDGQVALFAAVPPASWKRKLLKRVFGWELKLTEQGERT